jgi:hypothetical protein
MDKITMVLLFVSLTSMGLTLLFSRYMRNDKTSKVFCYVLFGFSVVCTSLFFIDLITSKL